MGGGGITDYFLSCPHDYGEIISGKVKYASPMVTQRERVVMGWVAWGEWEKRTRRHGHAHALIHSRTHVRTHARTHTHAHTHARTHTHTHTHTHTFLQCQYRNVGDHRERSNCALAENKLCVFGSRNQGRKKNE